MSNIQRIGQITRLGLRISPNPADKLESPLTSANCFLSLVEHPFILSFASVFKSLLPHQLSPPTISIPAMPILSSDEISTIFVVGFPPDFKEREFQNLFIFASGFEGASLKHPDPVQSNSPTSDESSMSGSSLFGEDGGCAWMGPSVPRISGPIKQQAIGFARFQRRQDALLARDHLNGRCVDMERGCTLKVEMAKKNLFIAPRKPLMSPMMLAGKDDQIDLGEGFDFGGPIVKTTRSLSLSIPGNPDPIDISIPSANGGQVKSPTMFPFALDSMKQASRTYSVNAAPASFYVMGENPPCNTLYVGNLPLNSDEEELRDLFSRCQGYKRLSFRTKSNGPMCFVEFEDVSCATQAMDSLYGTLLSTSTKGGIRLSYSKNPLGVRNGFAMDGQVPRSLAEVPMEDGGREVASLCQGYRSMSVAAPAFNPF